MLHESRQSRPGVGVFKVVGTIRRLVYRSEGTWNDVREVHESTEYFLLSVPEHVWDVWLQMWITSVIILLEIKVSHESGWIWVRDVCDRVSCRMRRSQSWSVTKYIHSSTFLDVQGAWTFIFCSTSQRWISVQLHYVCLKALDMS